MKVAVHKNNLQRALGFVERVTSRNAALPILNNVLFKTEKGRLKLIATNLEVGISSVIGAKVETDGQIAVPGRILADFIRAIPGDTVSLVAAQNTLTVDAGPYKTSILCFDPTEYPIIPKVEGERTYTLDAGDFRLMLARTSDSISLSDSRPELAGALLKFENDKTTIAATDSFRLFEQIVSAKNKNDATVILPRGTVAELTRVMGDVGGEITIRIADNQIAFAHDDVSVVSRLIDGKYPDYRKVIPERATTRVLVRRDELENAAKTTALFSSSIADINLRCHGTSLDVTAKNSSKGEAHATIEANTKGDSFDITLNHHYFLDGLKVLPTEKIVLEFTGKGSPFVLRPDDDSRVVYLIMPLRN